MFFRAAVIALLGSIIVMQVDNQIRLAQHEYTTTRRAHAQQQQHPRPRAVEASPPGSTQVVDMRRAELDRALRSADLAAQARLVPVVRDGAPNGFKVYAIRPGSLVQALGLRNGDTLLAVNDLALSGPIDALDTYSALQTGPAFLDLDVRRNGDPVRIVVLLHD
jgi:type II secretory pathway component PulC